jgi:AcrR family transcriptional regulator
VLDAAELHFAKHGYEPSTMADVAERAGVGVGTLYHHFPDKRALLLALIDDWGDRELSHRRAELDSLRKLRSGLRSAIGEFLAMRSRDLRKNGGFRLVLLELAERDGDVRARLDRIDQVAVERTRDLIEAGQARGVVRRTLDPLAAAFLIGRAVRSAAIEVFVHRVSEPTPEHVFKELVDLICRYVLDEKQ